MDAQAIDADVTGKPVVMVIKPLPDPAHAFLPVNGKLSDLLKSYRLIILATYCLLECL